MSLGEHPRQGASNARTHRHPRSGMNGSGHALSSRKFFLLACIRIPPISKLNIGRHEKVPRREGQFSDRINPHLQALRFPITLTMPHVVCSTKVFCSQRQQTRLTLKHYSKIDRSTTLRLVLGILPVIESSTWQHTLSLVKGTISCCYSIRFLTLSTIVRRNVTRIMRLVSPILTPTIARSDANSLPFWIKNYP